MFRFYIMHNTTINGKVFECLFKVVDGSKSFAQEQLAAAIEATGDTSMWLHLETEEERKNSWF